MNTRRLDQVIQLKSGHVGYGPGFRSGVRVNPSTPELYVLSFNYRNSSTVSRKPADSDAEDSGFNHFHQRWIWQLSGIKASYEKSLQYTIRWIFSRMQGSGLWMWCCFDRPATVSNVPVSNVDRCLPVFSKRRWFNGAISGQRPQSRKTGFKLVQCTSTSHMTTESIHLGWLELNRLSSRL